MQQQDDASLRSEAQNVDLTHRLRHGAVRSTLNVFIFTQIDFVFGGRLRGVYLCDGSDFDPIKEKHYVWEQPRP